MKQTMIYKTAALVALMVLAGSTVGVSAQQTKRGIVGDWLVKADYDGRQITSILSFSKDKEGNLGGQWISFWGVGKLRDLKHEGRDLSFLQVYGSGEREFKINFAGQIVRGKLTGTLSSDMGESKVTGARMKRMPMAAGSWDTKIKVGDREYEATLVIKVNKEGKLTGEWQSEWGEHKIADVKFVKGKLTFTRKSKVQDREWESTFEGTVKGHALSGTFKSDRGEITAEGKRQGGALVGKWRLKIASERGDREQILQINPDLSAMYGSISIEKIDVKGNELSFKRVLEFGDQKFEIGFKGKRTGRKLTGEITSSQGSRKVTGEKIRPVVRKKKN